MSEESKAVKEVARTTGKAIDAAGKLGNFIDKALGEGFGQLGQSFSDWAQGYRYNNLLKVVDRIEELHKVRKIAGKTIPVLPKYMIPILENVSIEDDEQISDMWAVLIANAMDPNRDFELRKLYIEILSSLDAIDAEILLYLNKVSDFIPPLGNTKDNLINADHISKRIERKLPDCLISLGNLARHGLIEDHWNNTIESLDHGYAGFSISKDDSNFRLSHLGRRLIENCISI